MANFTKLLSLTFFDASAGAKVSADAVSSGFLLPAPEAPELSAEAKVEMLKMLKKEAKRKE